MVPATTTAMIFINTVAARIADLPDVVVQVAMFLLIVYPNYHHDLLCSLWVRYRRGPAEARQRWFGRLTMVLLNGVGMFYPHTAVALDDLDLRLLVAWLMTLPAVVVSCYLMCFILLAHRRLVHYCRYAIRRPRFALVIHVMVGTYVLRDLALLGVMDKFMGWDFLASMLWNSWSRLLVTSFFKDVRPPPLITDTVRRYHG